LQRGKQPLAIGFFFSLGHSTVVVVLAIAIILVTESVTQNLHDMQDLGGIIGAGVSGTFLWMIGVLNFLTLLDILKGWRQAKTSAHSHMHVDELLSQRGFINRLFRGRLQKIVNHSWQMYPLGVLFGLGFDTASDVGLLVMTAGASAGSLPIAAVLSLPILFAAGMSAMDTTDGVLMSKAYSWAFVNPLRKIFYNLIITSLSIAVAMVIGTIELLQVSIHLLHLDGRFFDLVAGLDIGMLGYAIVGTFLAAWVVAVAVWKFGHLEERCGRDPPLHAEDPTHVSGLSHSHTHFP